LKFLTYCQWKFELIFEVKNNSTLLKICLTRATCFVHVVQFTRKGYCKNKKRAVPHIYKQTNKKTTVSNWAIRTQLLQTKFVTL